MPVNDFTSIPFRYLLISTFPLPGINKFLRNTEEFCFYNKYVPINVVLLNKLKLVSIPKKLPFFICIICIICINETDCFPMKIHD